MLVVVNNFQDIPRGVIATELATLKGGAKLFEVTACSHPAGKIEVESRWINTQGGLEQDDHEYCALCGKRIQLPTPEDTDIPF
jgi:hypothetical protein